MLFLHWHLFFIALSKACKRTENFKSIRRNLSIAVPHTTQVWLWTVAFFVGESLYLAKTKTVRQGIKFFYEICFWNQLKMSTLGGHKAGSLMGSRQSVYSHTSSAVRVTRAGTHLLFWQSFRKFWTNELYHILQEQNQEQINSQNYHGIESPLCKMQFIQICKEVLGILDFILW